MEILAVTPQDAADIAGTHAGLNPDHTVEVFPCPACGGALGVFCKTCWEPLCAVADAWCRQHD